MTANNDVIYIVDFSKSGNTWLTRLTADALERQVQGRVMRDSSEIAAEVSRLRPGSPPAKGYVHEILAGAAEEPSSRRRYLPRACIHRFPCAIVPTMNRPSYL